MLEIRCLLLLLLLCLMLLLLMLLLLLLLLCLMLLLRLVLLLLLLKLLLWMLLLGYVIHYRLVLQQNRLRGSRHRRRKHIRGRSSSSRHRLLDNCPMWINRLLLLLLMLRTMELGLLILDDRLM